MTALHEFQGEMFPPTEVGTPEVVEEIVVPEDPIKASIEETRAKLGPGPQPTMQEVIDKRRAAEINAAIAANKE